MGVYMKAIELPVDLVVNAEKQTAAVHANGHMVTLYPGCVISLSTRRSLSWLVVDVRADRLVVVDAADSTTKSYLWENLWSASSFIFAALRSGRLLVS